MTDEPPSESPRLSWTQPICERCWIEQETDGLSVRVPVRYVGQDLSIERCSWCGAPTIVGIFKRADPTTVPYPAVKSDVE